MPSRDVTTRKLGSDFDWLHDSPNIRIIVYNYDKFWRKCLLIFSRSHACVVQFKILKIFKVNRKIALVFETMTC